MNLSSLLYQFLVGGAIFTIGLILPWRSGDYSIHNREDRLTLFFMCLAFLVYLLLQILWHLYGMVEV